MLTSRPCKADELRNGQSVFGAERDCGRRYSILPPRMPPHASHFLKLQSNSDAYRGKALTEGHDCATTGPSRPKRGARCVAVARTTRNCPATRERSLSVRTSRFPDFRTVREGRGTCTKAAKRRPFCAVASVARQHR